MEIDSRSGYFFNRLIAMIAFLVWLAFVSLSHPALQKKTSAPRDSLYTRLTFDGRESVFSSKWTKAVIFNSAGTKLYALNLEEMSVYEFECDTRKLIRKFIFEPHAAPGWDYDVNKPIPSFEEKPVEGCFSHHDQILWVSLHNAGGVVGIPLNSLKQINVFDTAHVNAPSYPFKRLYVYDPEREITDTVSVPFVKTGRTPKVIAVTADSRHLLVSNWHSGTVSVLRLQDSLPPYAKKIKDIRSGVFPRGIAVMRNPPRTYVANMGSNLITLINNRTWKVEKQIPTIHNPRHVLSDARGRLFVSFNTSSKIACIDAASGRLLFSAATSARPRTIAFSKNGRFLFVACYEGNTIDVFRIEKGGFKRLYAIDCKGKPVGIDLREDETMLEAWVCTYEGESLQILRFRKTS